MHTTLQSYESQSCDKEKCNFEETPDFIPLDFWPPTGQDLNSVDYQTLYPTMQKCVYQTYLQD